MHLNWKRLIENFSFDQNKKERFIQQLAVWTFLGHLQKKQVSSSDQFEGVHFFRPFFASWIDVQLHVPDTDSEFRVGAKRTPRSETKFFSASHSSLVAMFARVQLISPSCAEKVWWPNPAGIKINAKVRHQIKRIERQPLANYNDSIKNGSPSMMDILSHVTPDVDLCVDAPHESLFSSARSRHIRLWLLLCINTVLHVVLDPLNYINLKW